MKSEFKVSPITAASELKRSATEGVPMAGMRDGPGVPTSTNTVHFACFPFRKAFKQWESSNWDSNMPERPFPECKQPMARMGRHFKAPQQRAVRAWQAMERLYLAGERFD